MYLIVATCYNGRLTLTRRYCHEKIYIVRLTDEERQTCLALVNKLKGTSQKVRRANILIKADAFCTINPFDRYSVKMYKKTHHRRIRHRTQWKKRETPPRQKLLDGKQEAQVIALRLSDPSEGRNAWTLRLLAEKNVELEIVPTISRTTVQQTLKK